MGIFDYLPDSEYETWQRTRKQKQREQSDADARRESLWRAAQENPFPLPSSGPGFSAGATSTPALTPDLIPGTSGAIGPYATTPKPPPVDDLRAYADQFPPLGADDTSSLSLPTQGERAGAASASAQELGAGYIPFQGIEQEPPVDVRPQPRVEAYPNTPGLSHPEIMSATGPSPWEMAQREASNARRLPNTPGLTHPEILTTPTTQRLTPSWDVSEPEPPSKPSVFLQSALSAGNQTLRTGIPLVQILQGVASNPEVLQPMAAPLLNFAETMGRKGANVWVRTLVKVADIANPASPRHQLAVDTSLSSSLPPEQKLAATKAYEQAVNEAIDKQGAQAAVPEGTPRAVLGFLGDTASYLNRDQNPKTIMEDPEKFAQFVENTDESWKRWSTEEKNPFTDLTADVVNPFWLVFDPFRLWHARKLLPGIAESARAVVPDVAGAAREAVPAATRAYEAARPGMEALGRTMADETGAVRFGGEQGAEYTAKEPWQMTGLEYSRSRVPASQREQITTAQKTFKPQHRKEIEAALSEGKPVPQEVINDYPDLAAKYGTPEAATTLPSPTSIESLPASEGVGAVPTPVIAQRIGDFYEAFGNDAQRLADALGVPLSKGRGGQLMAGIPYHSVDKYVQEAAAKGIDLQIAEQFTGSPALRANAAPTPTAAEMLARERGIKSQIAALQEQAPNLRDFGLDRRADYEAAYKQWSDQMDSLEAEYQAAGAERVKARQTASPELKPALTTPEPIKEKPGLLEQAAEAVPITPLLDRYNAVRNRLAEIGDEIGNAATESAMYREGVGIVRPPADSPNPAIRKLSSMSDDQLTGRGAQASESSGRLKELWDEERDLRLESRDIERQMDQLMGGEGAAEIPPEPLQGELLGEGAGGTPPPSGALPPTSQVPPGTPPKRPRKGKANQPPPPTPPTEGTHIPHIAPTETIEAWINKQSRLKPLVDLAGRVPGVKGVVSRIDPQLAQASALERIPLIYRTMQDQANNIIRDAMVQLEAVAPKGIEIKKGRFVKGVKPKAEYPDASLAWGDVAEHPYQYDMPDDLRHFFNTAHEVIDDFAAWGEKEGIDVHKIKYEEGGHYFGRLVRSVRDAKLTPKASPDMPRLHTEMKEGLEAGVDYENDMLATLNAVFNWYTRKIVGKRAGEMIQPLGRTAKELIDPKIIAARDKAVADAWTVRKYVETLRNIRDGRSIYYEVDQPGAKAGTKLLASIKAMDKLQPGIANRLQQAQSLSYGQRRDTILEMMKEGEKLQAKAIQTRKGATATQATAIKNIQKAPEAVVEGAKFGIDKEAVTASRIKQGFAGGRLFPKETADYLNRAFSNERETVLQALNTFGGAMQSIKAGADFGVMTLHLLPLAGSHPRVFAGATKHMYLSAVKPETHAVYMARADNVALRKKLEPYGLSIEGPEYVSALERGGGLDRAVGLIGKAGEPGQKVAGAIQKQGLKRAEMTFTAPLNYAKMELGKALLPSFEKRGQLRELAIFLNDVTGTRSSLEMGLGLGQRGVERLAFFSPRFLRSALALIGDASELSATSLKANEARKALLSIAGAMVFIPLGMRLASGQAVDDDFFDPSSGNFLTARVFDQDVGIGGVYRALVSLVANSYKTAQKEPGKFLNIRDRRENPLVRWVTSRTSIPMGMMFDIGEQRDFQGDKLDDYESWKTWGARQAAPFWAQEFITKPGEPGPSAATVLTQLHGFRASPLTPAERRDQARTDAAKTLKNPGDVKTRVGLWELQQQRPELKALAKSAQETYAERGSAYHQYKEVIDAEENRIQAEMATKKAGLDSGKLSGNEYREQMQLLERDMARRSDNALRNPKFQAAIDQIKRDQGAEETAKQPLDRYLDDYYQITQDLIDPQTDTLLAADVGELLRRREELKTRYPADVVQRATNYLNRNRDPQYVQALDEYREYKKIESKMSGMSEETLRGAVKFATLKRDIAQSLPPSNIRTERAERMARERDPEGYSLYRRRLQVEKAIGDRITRTKQDFWAKHPLLQKFFSSTPVQMPAKAAS